MPVRRTKQCGAVLANLPDSSEVGAGIVDSASASGGLAAFFFLATEALHPIFAPAC